MRRKKKYINPLINPKTGEQYTPEEFEEIKKCKVCGVVGCYSNNFGIDWYCSKHWLANAK